MPFGNHCEYVNFAACVAANADKENPEGYCAALMRETEEACKSMKTRYLSLDQFREHESHTRTAKGPVTLLDDQEERLVILAPQVPEIKALGGHDSRLIEFRITDETIDRMSDKLSIDGWDTDSYEKNPVVLWAHSHYDPPVGKALTLEVSKKKKEVKSITEFTPKELYPLGYMIYQMYLQKFMHAVSVGFFPKEYTWVSSDTDEERARRGGIDFLKQELLEYSAVPVPANPNALAVARSMGIDTTPLKQWAERVLDESTSKNLTDDARRRVEVLRAASSPDGRALILEIGDMKMKTSEGENPPAPPSKTTLTVKEVVTRRWDCGTEGHVHATQQDAEECASLDLIVIAASSAIDAVVKSVKARCNGDVTKAGRVLSKKNQDTLQAAADAMKAASDSINTVLAQVADGGDGEAEDDDSEGDKSNSGVVAVEFADAGEQKDQDVDIQLDPADIERAIREVVDDSIMRLTGRVD